MQYGCNYLDPVSSCSGSSLAHRHGATVMTPESFSPSPLPCWEFKSHKESRAQIGSQISCLVSSLQPPRAPIREKKKSSPCSALLYKCPQVCLFNSGEDMEQWNIHCTCATLIWIENSWSVAQRPVSSFNDDVKSFRASSLLDSWLNSSAVGTQKCFWINARIYSCC